MDELKELTTDEILSALQDPFVVHLNMLYGKIAKPSMDQIAHIYQDEFRDYMFKNYTKFTKSWNEKHT